MEESVVTELLPFLAVDAAPHLQNTAMLHLEGVTGSDEGCETLAASQPLLAAMVALLNAKSDTAKRAAYSSLVNLSAYSDIARKLMKLPDQPQWVTKLLQSVMATRHSYCDFACKILANLTREAECASKIIDDVSDEIGFDKVIYAFCQMEEDDLSNAKLDYLGSFFMNLTQIPKMRQFILDKERVVIQRLIPFTEYSKSSVRRRGIVGTIKNCCFDYKYHEWLLGPDVDLLPRLLLPLAGPEEFDDDDNDKLSLDLQYLPPEKTREPEPDIRKMLVEAVFQLCTAKAGREYIIDHRTYVIMRELFNWETDPAAKASTQAMIDLLISDQPEPGMENLKQVDVPEKLQKDFAKDQEMLDKEIAEENAQLKQAETTDS